MSVTDQSELDVALMKEVCAHIGSIRTVYCIQHVTDTLCSSLMPPEYRSNVIVQDRLTLHIHLDLFTQILQ